ncbi:Uncharacterised protein [Ectopseudomonas mendocina]|jgi:hypothetical protein|uniref:hypothetical protein n=1 Tax=Ectopseudomonas mendocina TaxID=300 RepID=UPI000DFDA04B|nr:hypothetical protein [Pseudomonas mendocina]SUD37001.1 Uncharacterised protein [Pseudomonas mendocina]
MKADRDDAPEWLTSRPRKNGNLGFVLAGAIGMVVTLGALTVAGQAFMQTTVKNLAENRQQPKPKLVAEITRAEPAPKIDWDEIVEEQARRDAMFQPQPEQPTGSDSPAIKQAVFNDQNYTRKDAINLINAREWGAAEPYEQTRKRQEEQKIIVIGQQNRPEDWICSYAGKEGSLGRRDCKFRYQLSNRNTGR